jgi:hypothetical protein
MEIAMTREKAHIIDLSWCPSFLLSLVFVFSTSLSVGTESAGNHFRQHSLIERTYSSFAQFQLNLSLVNLIRTLNRSLQNITESRARTQS